MILSVKNRSHIMSAHFSHTFTTLLIYNADSRPWALFSKPELYGWERGIGMFFSLEIVLWNETKYLHILLNHYLKNNNKPRFISISQNVFTMSPDPLTSWPLDLLTPWPMSSPAIKPQSFLDWTLQAPSWPLPNLCPISRESERISFWNRLLEC